MAEYYEWLTPEHSEFGLKKQMLLFRNIDDYFEYSSVSIEFLEKLDEYVILSKKLTAIDILPQNIPKLKTVLE